MQNKKKRQNSKEFLIKYFYTSPITFKKLISVILHK